ncbi:uncharacterized protein LOC108227894 [Daucus carota subsp. sativus]|uniref:uncharacterized protein LOC108227894 n=1 Tax=Daucus carota subsp. sativus TaxID=79200 RepID=UPI0030827451
MSNDSFAVALRNLGGTHTIPKPAAKSKSGSGKNDESGSSQQGAAGGESSVAVEKVALGMTAEVQESGSPDLVTRGTKRKQPSARKAPAKIPKSKSDQGKEIMVGSESDSDESEDPEREDTRVVLGAGKYSAREIIKLMSGIPTDEDWVKMDDTGLVNTFREIGSLWGQLGARLAGFNTMAFEVIKSERDTADACGERTRKAESSLAQEKSEREKLESELERRVKEAETRMQAAWKEKVDDAEARAVDAEKKASGFEEEVGVLKRTLEERKEAGVVIAEFQKSTAYADALNHAAAAEVVRCWHVAERHIKSDPGANLQSFIEAYLAAKDNIKAGKGEPEPYEGPSPSFIVPANPGNHVVLTTSDVPVDPGSQANNSSANDPPVL